jgi:hypothetical protein
VRSQLAQHAASDDDLKAVDGQIAQAQQAYEGANADLHNHLNVMPAFGAKGPAGAHLNPLPRDTLLQFMRQSGSDVEKAKQLATQNGFDPDTVIDQQPQTIQNGP